MLSRAELQQALAGPPAMRRLTQGSPIRPDVWYHYVIERGGATPTLLIPFRGVGPGRLFKALQDSGVQPVAYNQSVVLVEVGFEALVRAALPLSDWWRRHRESILDQAQDVIDGDLVAEDLSTDSYYFLESVGLVLSLGGGETETSVDEVRDLCDDADALVRRAGRFLRQLRPAPAELEKTLYGISCNRPATISSSDSCKTIKGDAARRLFHLECDGLTWAVLDTGIDATHPAFGQPPATGETGPAPAPPPAADSAPGKPPAKKAAKKAAKKVAGKMVPPRAAAPGPLPLSRSRVAETYDFTRLTTIVELATSPDERDRELLAQTYGLDDEVVRGLAPALQTGRDIDWELLKPALHLDDASRGKPLHPHGTHVAGILGGCGGVAPPSDEYEDDDPSAGVCPDIGLMDIRVLDEEGNGDEFSIIAALQFIRYLNGSVEKPIVHGVNLSLQMMHDVTEYACGRTPVCEECDRLVASGVIVVAAAGNRGFGPTGAPVGVAAGPFGDVVGGYETTSITDPGNAESVITVGSTHRSEPHTYGVSYFSSRGPTGDGRCKPDLVGPGERIPGPVLDGGYDSMDGTSQAAPHVSGAAAMLIARNPELIGQPRRVKEILCETATNLGRRRDFQGRGLTDVLRALQYI